MSDTLLELAARCEAATGPDRELDAEVHRVVGGLTVYDVLTPKGDIRDDVPRYTGSLDSSKSLKPEGWIWFASDGDEGGPYAFVHEQSDTRPSGVRCATVELASVAAALRARAAQ